MRRAIENLLYAPVGLVSGAREVVPELADRGRVQVANAKMLGRIAFQQGSSTVAQQLSGIRSQLRDSLAGAGLVSPDEAPHHAAGTSATVDQAPEPETDRAPRGESSPAASTLPIVDYDSLAASQVVPRLATLTPDDLETVQRYEVSHRGRKTILGRIAQLQR